MEDNADLKLMMAVIGIVLLTFLIAICIIIRQEMYEERCLECVFSQEECYEFYAYPMIIMAGKVPVTTYTTHTRAVDCQSPSSDGTRQVCKAWKDKCKGVD